MFNINVSFVFVLYSVNCTCVLLFANCNSLFLFVNLYLLDRLNVHLFQYLLRRFFIIKYLKIAVLLEINVVFFKNYFVNFCIFLLYIDDR